MSGTAGRDDWLGLAWLRGLGRFRLGRAWVAMLVAVAGLVVLMLGPAVAVLAFRDRATGQEPARLEYGIGDPVEAGPITFVVHEVRCGTAEPAASQGRLCEVTLGARNAGRSEITVPSQAQTLHMAQGARHLPARDGTGEFGPLAPGAAATAVIRYDVPAEATITHLELRADIYSRGVSVAVGLPYPLLPRD